MKNTNVLCVNGSASLPFFSENGMGGWGSWRPRPAGEFAPRHHYEKPLARRRRHLIPHRSGRRVAHPLEFSQTVLKIFFDYGTNVTASFMMPKLALFESMESTCNSIGPVVPAGTSA